MNKVPAKASDPNDLERHVLDPNIAKSEAEWWAKSRIEELECENEALAKNLRGKHSITGATYAHLIYQRDALQADNARLREALDKAMRYDWADQDGAVPNEVVMQCLGALAATPEQSLARLRKPE